MKINKTNAMRFLDTKKVIYEMHHYDAQDGKIDAISVAEKTGIEIEYIYKTLVTRSASKRIYVFVINAQNELDLKLCAKAVHEKSIEMIHVAEIYELTGYIRGGCSFLGMKKNYPVIFSETINEIDRIVFSGGKIGLQIDCSIEELKKAITITTAPIIRA